MFAASSLTEVFPRIDRRPRLQLRRLQPARLPDPAGRAGRRVRLGQRRRTPRRSTAKVSSSGPRTFATNALVLAVPRSNPAELRSVYDLRATERQARGRHRSVSRSAPTRGACSSRLGLSIVLDEGRQPGARREEHRRQGRARARPMRASSTHRRTRRLAAVVRAIRIPAWAQPAVRYEVAVVRASRHRGRRARRFVAALRRAARARAAAPPSRLQPCREAGRVHRRSRACARRHRSRSCSCRWSRSSCEVPPGRLLDQLDQRLRARRAARDPEDEPDRAWR